MKLIVGLGNSGKKFTNTRHNIGFMVVEKLARGLNSSNWRKVDKFKSEIADRKPFAILAKPQTFMNDSGIAVKKLVSYYKLYIPDVIVVHDDLDIQLGQYKIQQGHGPRLHNGINSIEKSLKSENFWRVRVGVDNRIPESRTPGDQYVLQNFIESELKERDGVVDAVVGKLTEIVKEG